MGTLFAWLLVLRGVNMPCSRTTRCCQCHGDRSHDLSIRIPMLYHYVTTLLFIICLFVCLFVCLNWCLTSQSKACHFCLPHPILSFIPSYWFIQLQNSFDNRNVDTFVSKMHFWKISEICDFWLKTRFFTKKFFFRLKCCTLHGEHETENRF